MKQHRSTSLLSLLVFTLFALCLLLVLLTGAKVYRQTVRDTALASDARVKAQLVSVKIRQSESAEAGTFCGKNALILRESIDGEQYITYLYIQEGYLRELFCAEGAGLRASDGEKLLPAQTLRLEQTGGLLTVTIDGQRLIFDQP